MLKILVSGCNGMLGTDLMFLLKADGSTQVVGLDLPDIDVTKLSSIEAAVDRVRPDWIVNCAAMTDVDGCEARRELAFAVNGEAPGLLARAAKRSGARLLHISTDFVFDGEKKTPYVEDDPPHPLSVYGESKLRGEIAVQNETKDFVILRTAWLFGKKGKNFIEIIRGLAAQRPEIRVVTDQIGSPTYTVHLARGILTAIRKDIRGLYHLTNSGYCSRFDWAANIPALTGLKTKVLPATSAEFPRAKRPASSALDCTKFVHAAGYEMPRWEEAVAEYLDEERH